MELVEAGRESEAGKEEAGVVGVEAAVPLEDVREAGLSVLPSSAQSRNTLNSR